MTTDLLVKVVSEFYFKSDILNAKKELFEKVIINGKTQRLIKRQGNNKNDMNVKDILEFLHLPDAYMNDDPSSKPIYATATCNFPPVDVKNIDGLTIVHDLNMVKEEIKSLQKKSSAVQQLSDQLAEIRCMVSELSALTRKNAPKDLSHLSLPFQDPQSMISKKPTYAEKVLSKTSESSSSEMVHEPPSSLGAETTESETSKVISKQHQDNENWSIQTKRKKLVKKSNERKLKGSQLLPVPKVAKPAEVFISRLQPCTTVFAIENFAKNQFKNATSISCTQLRTRFDSYASFPLTIAGISFKESVNPENWPEGVLVKRFYAKSTAVDDSPSKSVNTPTTNSKV